MNGRLYTCCHHYLASDAVQWEDSSEKQLFELYKPNSEFLWVLNPAPSHRSSLMYSGPDLRGFASARQAPSAVYGPDAGHSASPHAPSPASITLSISDKRWTVLNLALRTWWSTDRDLLQFWNLQGCLTSDPRYELQLSSSFRHPCR